MARNGFGIVTMESVMRILVRKDPNMFSKQQFSFGLGLIFGFREDRFIFGLLKIPLHFYYMLTYRYRSGTVTNRYLRIQ